MAKTERILIDNIPPLHDLECEKAVLGALTIPGNYKEIPESLSEDCFYDDLNRNIFQCIKEIMSQGGHPELIRIKGELEKKNVKFQLGDLLGRLNGMTLDLEQYANRLFDLSVRRKYREIGLYLLKHSATEEEDAEHVQAKAGKDLAGIYRRASDGISTLHDGLVNVHQIVNRNLAGESSLTGTPTGFSKFDSRAGGLQKSHLLIIAAEQGMGKTALLLCLLRNAALSGAGSIIYSMEMKKEEISARLASIESGIPTNQILYSKLQDHQIPFFDGALGRISNLPIYFDDTSTSNIDTIISSIRYMKRMYNIEGAAVDYLQILNVHMKGNSPEQQLADVARRLKDLAKELDIWIIALSQLSRDKDNPVPSENRLRGSGQIAEAADIVLLLYRPEKKGRSYPEPFTHVDPKGTAMIDISKGRNIGESKFIVKFNAPTTHFYDIDELPTVENAEEEAPY